MLQRLSEWLRRERLPAGYRPGVTLTHVGRNLAGAGLHFEPLEHRRGRFLSDDLAFEACERTQSQLLMHLVFTEFSLELPAVAEGPLRLELFHRGAWRRTGVGCKGPDDAARQLGQALLTDDALRQALLPLDFKRLLIERSGQRWCVRLEHMGGSEVVNRVPAFRRYIRIDGSQRALLLATLTHLQRLLGGR
ncbi:DUF3156 family protein [Pseudomonas sp. ABC1]|nr:DUF3156 family protein [Pseudomonas sp. ABC1]